MCHEGPRSPTVDRSLRDPHGQLLALTGPRSRSVRRSTRSLVRYMGWKSAQSPTRRIMARIEAKLDGVSVLQTNIHDVDAGTVEELGRGQSTAAFEFLLREVDPQLLVIYGLPAIRFLESKYGESCPREAVGEFGDRMAIGCRHFSRGWSYAAADALGVMLRDAAS